MPCLNFFAQSAEEIVTTTINFLTDKAQMGTAAAWELITPATLPGFTDEAIIKAPGKDGGDEIFIGVKIIERETLGQKEITFNGFAAYDDGLKWEEQPGHIYHPTLPIIPIPDNTRVECWLTANAQRFVLVVQLSTQYEHVYCGFFHPISVERQYPYPLAIGGSFISNSSWSDNSDAHSAWFNPGGTAVNDATTLRVRLSDGTWVGGLNTNTNHTPNTPLPVSNQVTGALCTWPQNVSPTNVLTVLDTELTIENIIMFPIILYQGGEYRADYPAEPSGIIGQFDGVYFVGNREDLSSKDTLIHNGKPYMVFANVARRDNDAYIAMEWF